MALKNSYRHADIVREIRAAERVAKKSKAFLRRNRPDGTLEKFVMVIKKLVSGRVIECPVCGGDADYQMESWVGRSKVVLFCCRVCGESGKIW